MRISLTLAATFMCSLPLAAAAVDDEGYPMGKAGWGAFAVPAPLSVQAERDLLPGEGVVVLHVRPEGTADKLGIHRGDVILSINDTPISNRRDIRNLMTTVTPGDAANVSIIRESGATSQLHGVFKERTPRPPGTPPWAGFRPPGDGRPGDGRPPGVGGFMSEDPAAAIDRQYEQLLTERRALEAAKIDLAAARAAAPVARGAWYMHVNVATQAEVIP